MKGSSRYLTLLSLLIMAAFITHCNNGNGKKDKNGKDSTATIPVEVTKTEIGAVSAFFTGTTTLEAEEDALAVAKVNGIVEEILVEEGDYVQSGDILARLDDEIYRIQLAQAEATMLRLESEYRRNEAMFEKNAVSAQVLQSSKYNYKSQKAIYELAQLNLDHTAIKAPISGIITERHVKIGNMVLTNVTTFRITTFDPLLAVLHIPERELSKLRKGQKAIINVDALPNLEFTGFVDRISPIVNPNTGTVKITLEAYDPTHRLKAGMFARISIIYDIHDNTMLIPKDAIIKEDRESAVFVVRDSIAYRQTIETGFTNSTHVEVLSGINREAVVVTAGQGSLKDSSRVELIKP